MMIDRNSSLCLIMMIVRNSSLCLIMMIDRNSSLCLILMTNRNSSFKVGHGCEQPERRGIHQNMMSDRIMISD